MPAAHAPAGGVDVQGRRYPGGQFIPADVMATATRAERQAVQGGSSEPDARRPSVRPDVATAPPKTKTEAFKRWFGDWTKARPGVVSSLVSAVVNRLTGQPQETYRVQPSAVTHEDGAPRVVYHGTKGEFTVFDEARQNEAALYGPGFYFTEDEEVATSYTAGNALRADGASGEQGDGRVMACYLNIRQPFDADAALLNVLRNPGVAKFSYEFIADALGGNRAATARLKALGFDGITHRGDAKDGKKHRVWVAFEPNQIKSVNNTGTFDPSNADIRFSRGCWQLHEAWNFSQGGFAFSWVYEPRRVRREKRTACSSSPATVLSRLAGHAPHELGERDREAARLSLNVLLQRHGDGVLGRIEELAKVDSDKLHAGSVEGPERDRLLRRIHAYRHMAEWLASKPGVP